MKLLIFIFLINIKMVDKTSSIHSVKPNIHEAQSFGLPKIASASKGSESGYLPIEVTQGAKQKINTEGRNSPIQQRNSKFTSTGNNKFKTHHIEVDNVQG